VSPILAGPPKDPPERIVSLVPSITESLFALGLGDRVVGLTDWCVHPAEEVAHVPKVGGTKDADPDAIASLEPDLVLANHEENTRRVVEDLDTQGLAVWVTYPRRVREGAELLLALANLGASEAARREVAQPVMDAVEAAEAARRARSDAGLRVFCPIWRDPWMAPSADTYIHDMIELCGGVNVSAEMLPHDARRKRRARGATGERYPKLSLPEVAALAPDVVWLPDEPYAFARSDALELGGLDMPAATSGRIHLIDGTWVSWYGPRIRQAIQVLGDLLTPRASR
jgi:ABC-type Fe3+-hydroxamate transport system substrate-binding protein